MSWLLLIDGYNVIAPVAGPGRNPDPNWLHAERTQLLQRLIAHLSDDIRHRTCVVFDAANPPPDRPDRFEVEGLSVRFAIEYPEADDLLEELIAAHSAPKNLAVVSSDHRVQAAAKRRGCQTFDSQRWLDDLMRGSVHLAVDRSNGAGEGSRRERDKPDFVDDDDVSQWMRDFGF